MPSATTPPRSCIALGPVVALAGGRYHSPVQSHHNPCQAWTAEWMNWTNSNEHPLGNTLREGSRATPSTSSGLPNHPGLDRALLAGRHGCLIPMADQPLPAESGSAATLSQGVAPLSQRRSSLLSLLWGTCGCYRNHQPWSATSRTRYCTARAAVGSLASADTHSRAVFRLPDVPQGEDPTSIPQTSCSTSRRKGQV